jgi:hypothetical protein
MRFLVSGAALLRQFFERALGVAVAQQRAGIAPRRSFGEDVDRRVEPDGDRALVQQLARARIHIGAAAGRDHPDGAIDEARDKPPFAIAEIGFAEPFIDFGRRQAGGVGDRRIAVDERQAQPPGEPPSDRRFPHSHQPHQHDWPVEPLD